MRKTLEQKIEENKNQREHLKKEHDLLMAQFNKQEQKAKNKRIYERGDIIEKHLPEIIPLTAEQFDIFVEKVLLTNFARRILKELKAENETPTDTQDDSDTVQSDGTAAQNPKSPAAHTNSAPAQKTAGAA